MILTHAQQLTMKTGLKTKSSLPTSSVEVVDSYENPDGFCCGAPSVNRTHEGEKAGLLAPPEYTIRGPVEYLPDEGAVGKEGVITGCVGFRGSRR